MNHDRSHLSLYTTDVMSSISSSPSMLALRWITVLNVGEGGADSGPSPLSLESADTLRTAGATQMTRALPGESAAGAGAGADTGAGETRPPPLVALLLAGALAALDEGAEAADGETSAVGQRCESAICDARLRRSRPRIPVSSFSAAAWGKEPLLGDCG